MTKDVARDLLPWLRAQIAEIEEEARDAMLDRGGEWILEIDPRSDSWWKDPWNPSVIAGGKPIATCDEQYGGRPVAVHIARNDPRTVLAQCEAHTAILDRYERTAARIEVSVSSYVRGQDDGYRQACWAAVLDVALGYQHNPGYQEAWRPDGTG